MNEKHFTCSVCGETKPVQKEGGTGYGNDPVTDAKVCYACCALNDAKSMKETGRADLYLSKKPEGSYTVTNWPGTLSFKVYNLVKGRHNIAGSRYDVWFAMEDGIEWHGVQYGEWTQICHCRRKAGLKAPDKYAPLMAQ